MVEYVDNLEEKIDAHGMFLLPSFVSGHTHLYSQFARGLSLPYDPKDFQEILDQLWWRLDRELDNETTYYSALSSGIEHLQAGVTTLIDHHASGKTIKGSLDAIKQALNGDIGMRAVLCFETSDRFQVHECIAENLNIIQAEHSPFLSGLFGLHASLSLSDETLAKVKNVLGEVPIHIHVGESSLDQEDSYRKYGMSVIKRLDRFGLLNEDSLLVHCVHVDDEELEIIKKRKAIIAINPSSNLNNSVGLPNYERIKKYDIPVILGNDGLDQGMAQEYRNLLFTQHLAQASPSAFSLLDLKAVIEDTYAYASRRLNIKLGRLKNGFEADFLLLPYLAPTPVDQGNALGHLVYGLFSKFKPEHVFVGGVQLINDYRLKKGLEELFLKAAPIARKLWNRL
jgi:cytosine/adenosine deaminase-related metal-dependent hydrolase